MKRGFTPGGLFRAGDGFWKGGNGPLHAQTLYRSPSSYAFQPKISSMRKSGFIDPLARSSLRRGPLGPHLENFAAVLSQQGYCKAAAWNKVRLVADLSRWLERERIALKQLDERLVTVFLENRWKRVAHRSGDQATLSLLLQQLRQANLTPTPAAAPLSAIDLIERDYECFLLRERGLMRASVEQYLPVAQRFLSHRFGNRKVELKKLRAKEVTDFVSQDTAGRGRRSAQLMTSVLRSFFGFLLQEGRIDVNLAAAVPTVAGWRLSELPRFLEAAQVEKVLRCCDRRTKVGKRDYAILLLLARLGLRAGEVAYLNLDDIDWDAGKLCIRGKGARVDTMPLLHDVGQAIAEYLKKGRPRCSSRRVFIQSKAPFVGFASPPNTVCGIVRRALGRAQLNPRQQGAHLLRHSLATRMLGQGASLAQISQVLRHQQTETTEIYAKVNLEALRALAQPWPEGEER